MAVDEVSLSAEVTACYTGSLTSHPPPQQSVLVDSLKVLSRTKYNKSFYVRNLRTFIIS
jgi:hypothetical protein